MRETFFGIATAPDFALLQLGRVELWFAADTDINFCEATWAPARPLTFRAAVLALVEWLAFRRRACPSPWD